MGGGNSKGKKHEVKPPPGGPAPDEITGTMAGKDNSVEAEVGLKKEEKGAPAAGRRKSAQGTESAGASSAAPAAESSETAPTPPGAQPKAAAETYNAQGWCVTRSPHFKEYCQLLGDDAVNTKPAHMAKGDVLLVIDMQNDFCPADENINPFGGAFGVLEGLEIEDEVCHLIKAAVEVGATVCATRDYHPLNHASFLGDGGPFPPHCIQGSIGSRFRPSVATALAMGMERRGTENVFVAFKAFHEHVDSFGAFPYYDGGDGRVVQKDSKKLTSPMGCAASPWTGSMILKQSGLCCPRLDGTFDYNLDAPPDVLAVQEDGVDRKLATLQDAVKAKLGEGGRIFVCGLALDFCVLDTCLNARAAGFERVHMVMDACRAAYISGVGAFGTGFLQDPKDVLAKIRASDVILASTEAIAGAHKLNIHQPSAFPNALSLSLTKTTKLVLEKAHENKFSVGLDSTPMLKTFGLDDGTQGTCTPPVPVPKGWPGAPEKATTFSWGNPTQCKTKAGIALMSLTTSPELFFVVHGGFIFFDKDGKVLGSQSASTSHKGGVNLQFGSPSPWRKEYTPVIENRVHNITIFELRSGGAEKFCWISPGEELEVNGNKWIPSPTGCFVYFFEDTDFESGPILFPKL